MDAKVFLQELYEMCKRHSVCEKCPLYTLKEEHNIYECRNLLMRYPDECINLVEGYKRTRQSEYLKVFPKAATHNGVLNVCPAVANGAWACSNVFSTCFECQRKFWLEEIK